MCEPKEIVVRISDDEASVVANKMAESYGRQVRYYREKEGLAPAEAVAQADAPPVGIDVRQRGLEGPPNELDWWDLENLMQQDPAAVPRAWARVRALAREQLSSGMRAAQTIDSVASLWQNEQFLAIREQIARDWAPLSGAEMLLVDQMSIAHSGYLLWMARMYARVTYETQAEDNQLKKDGRWKVPSLSEAAAVEQAGAMAHRCQSEFLRSLRALRDLRRYIASNVVINTGQVNLAANGGQQINQVNAKPDLPPGETHDA